MQSTPKKPYLVSIMEGLVRKIFERRAHRMPVKDSDKQSMGSDAATLAQIVQGSTVPTFVIDRNHIVTVWNRALENLSGLSAAEVVGTDRQWAIFKSGKRPTVADLIVDGKEINGLQRRYGAKHRRSPQIAGAYETEDFYPNLGENGKWLFCTAAPIRSPEGRTIGAIETLWDRTEEKRRAEETKRRAEFQQMLITSSNDGIVATEKNSRIAIFNPAAEKIFGYSAVEVLDRFNAADLFPAEVNATFERQMRTGPTEQGFPWFEVEIVSKNGTPIPVRCSGNLLIEDGRVIGRVAFFQDLREIKQLQRELIVATRLSTVGQTVAGLAHYIKNILTGLGGGSYVVDVALKDDNPAKLKDGWGSVKRNIGRISELVQDLLTYSKEREPEYARCKPNEIIDDLFDLLHEQARRCAIEIVKTCDPAIGEVVMDACIIHRSLLNLLTNAIDACIMDENREKQHCIRIRTTREKVGLIRFDVDDNGTGIDPETQSKLFTVLFSTKGGKGTGIGLLVTQKLVKEHGGQIHLVSKPGEGSTFTIRLPYRPVGEDCHR